MIFFLNAENAKKKKSITQILQKYIFWIFLDFLWKIFEKACQILDYENEHQEGLGNVFAEVSYSTENITVNYVRATESAERVQASLTIGIPDNLSTLKEHCQPTGVLIPDNSSKDLFSYSH